MICPICRQDHGPLIRHFENLQDDHVLHILEEESPGWKPEAGACTRCVDQAQLEQWQKSDEQEPLFSKDQALGFHILPIPLRLTAHPAYRGKGVTICFIDSGFFPHPDLCLPENRMLRILDIHRLGEEQPIDWNTFNPRHWHGTMTSVVGAGNGYMSDGIYRSLAPEAKLVLIKVMDEEGKISGEAISAALHWVLENHQEYGIRIVNLSVTDDEALPYRETPIGRAIEKLFQAGINVVAAAGNATGVSLKAPASIPHAITVGGLDDHNSLHPLAHTLYHSTYGETADHTFKPEIIAPAIWLPAPILPGSPEHREAEALWKIKNSDSRFRPAVAANLLPFTRLSQRLVEGSPGELIRQIDERIERAKYISPHYQHADGTSFAAPIVCGVIAQMLEANPNLTPGDIRDILFRSARRLPGLPEERQGFGIVHPLSAVHAAEREHQYFPPFFNPVIDYKSKTIEFHFHEETARTVSTLGSFQGWHRPGLQLSNSGTAVWEGKLAMPEPGVYSYKFLVDDDHWTPDTRNLYQAPDGYGGFHSLLILNKF